MVSTIINLFQADMDTNQYTNSIYSEIILDHYKYPSGNGLKTPFILEAKQFNPSCGDEITLRIHQNQTISYHAKGCIISMASASIMYELFEKTNKSKNSIMILIDNFKNLMHTYNVEGMTDLEKKQFDNLGDAISLSGVSKYPMRVKCALLPWMGLKDVILRTSSLDNDKR